MLIAFEDVAAPPSSDMNARRLMSSMGSPPGTRCAGFQPGDTSDIMLRGGVRFEINDVCSNNVTGAAVFGSVGQEWQTTGFGDFSSLGETDMILRNTGTGGMQVYDISNNQITGTVFLGTVSGPGTIPKTTSGKIQRARARQMWLQGSFESLDAACV